MASLHRRPIRLAASAPARLLRPRARPRPPPVRRAARACAETVPDLQHLLNQMCSDCGPGMYLGSADEQMQVVRGFYQLAHAFDLTYGAPYVLKALLAHDLLAAAQLAYSFDQYAALVRAIHEAVDALPPMVDPTAMGA